MFLGDEKDIESILKLYWTQSTRESSRPWKLFQESNKVVLAVPALLSNEGWWGDIGRQRERERVRERCICRALL